MIAGGAICEEERMIVPAGGRVWALASVLLTVPILATAAGNSRRVLKISRKNPGRVVRENFARSLQTLRAVVDTCAW